MKNHHEVHDLPPCVYISCMMGPNRITRIECMRFPKRAHTYIYIHERERERASSLESSQNLQAPLAVHERVVIVLASRDIALVLIQTVHECLLEVHASATAH